MPIMDKRSFKGYKVVVKKTAIIVIMTKIITTLHKHVKNEWIYFNLRCRAQNNETMMQVDVKYIRLRMIGSCINTTLHAATKSTFNCKPLIRRALRHAAKHSNGWKKSTIAAHKALQHVYKQIDESYNSSAEISLIMSIACRTVTTMFGLYSAWSERNERKTCTNT